MDILNKVPKSLRIWSLDGGGKGVLSQLMIIDKIMHRIQYKQRSDNIPLPCDYADILIGSGLGGAAAILMGRLRLSASETYDEITQLGKAVFETPAQRKGQAKPNFSLQSLRAAISSILERHGFRSDSLMKDDQKGVRGCHVVVLASSQADVTGYKCLKTYDTTVNTEYTIMDAIAATMAVPGWFEPVTIALGDQKHIFIGGSLGHNNPTWEGLLEAKQIFGVDARVTSVISLGSGKVTSIAPATHGPKYDNTSIWIEQMYMECEKTARRLSEYFHNISAYARFTVDNALDDIDISSWSDGEIEVLNVRVVSYLGRPDVEKQVEKTVANLVQDVGSVTLAQITQVMAAPPEAKSVPRLTPYYVPRLEVHGTMEKCLSDAELGTQKMLVLHGMAGSGKTQSSSFFERTHRKRYKHVFFIDSSSVASIKADLQSAVRSLGGSHSQDTFKDAIRYLESTESGHWLVIFDNADDPNLPLIDFIPSCDHGHIIITTRNPDLALLAPTSHINIPKMEDAEALSVLYLASQSLRPKGQAYNEHAVEICRLVGYLPLALVQVGCFCYSSKTTFSQYLERFKEHRQRLMTMRPGWQLDKYPHSAYTSISLSYSLLNETEKSLFHLLSIFHPSNIPIDIFRVSSQHQFTVDSDIQLAPRGDQHEQCWKELQCMFTKDGKWNQPRLDELLLRLQSFSLLSLGSDDSTSFIMIHPLVQSFAQDTLTTEDFHRYHYMAALTLSGSVQDDSAKIFRHLFPHIFEVERYKVQLHVNDAAAFVYLSFVMFFDKEALEQWKLIEDRCQKQFGPDHRSTLYVAAQTASCLRTLGEHDSAMAILQRVIPIQERVLGVEHSDTLHSYNKFAYTLREQHKYHDAEAVIRKRLQSVERKYGRDHKDTAVTLSSLGENLYQQGRWSEAEDMFRTIIPTLQRIFSEDNKFLLTSLGTFARALMELGKWDEAEDILRHVVATAAKSFGIEEPNTLYAMVMMSRCVQHRGELKEAEGIQRSCIALFSKRFADDHKYVIVAKKALDKTLELLDQHNVDLKADNSPRMTSGLERDMVYYIILSCLMASIAGLVLYFI